jgi:acyl dehydratase
MTQPAQEPILTPARTIGEGDIALFAGLTGDFTPIHVDQVFAETTPHGGRIAHGPHALSVAIGLATQCGLFGERVIGLVGLNWDFVAPVRIGDTIRARVTPEPERPTSKPGRSLGGFGFEVINQTGAVIQTGRILVVLRDSAG